MRGMNIVRDALAKAPPLDAWFRRLVWSRIHFPEDELRFLSRLPANSIDVAIDVGGALGSYAWPLNRKSRRVIVFEPGQVHADFLGYATALSRIELQRMAVGNKPGTLNLYTPGHDVNARHSATLSQTNPTIDTELAEVNSVEVVTIDGFASEHLHVGERLDVLKVDVEGFELAVFEGATGRIAADHPLIFCEIEARHNPRYQEVFELLAGLRYTAYAIRRGKLEELKSFDIRDMQTKDALAYRISDRYKPGTSDYINNFVFEHPSSRVKISTGSRAS